ncbi:MAG: hypothetical protein LAQ69_38835 [Acidobacteriia bacterium]|nr:hypothetical protein [Terriglobia bacterium]
MPLWFRPLMLVLSAALLIGWFSPDISDGDTWWLLKTGRYIVQNHSLPVPDPFAYTTASASPGYAGEERTRHFNLTHEWLTQVLFYGVYRAVGLGGLVFFRAVLLLLCCALVGLVAYHRCGGFYRSLAAALAAACVLSLFAADRPFVITFLLLAATLAILEWTLSDRQAPRSAPRLVALWLLPIVLLIWANCHGGYFLGWVVLAAYSAEALILRLRHRPIPGDRILWLVSAVSIAVSGLNPNGYRIPQILGYYRHSYLTSRLLEWAPAPWWPAHWYTVLLFGGVAALLSAWRRVRLVDWMLFAAFAIAASTAYRNVVLIGIVAPVYIVSYVPVWKRGSSSLMQYSAAAALVAGLAAGIAGGSFFQFRANPWKWPSGAAEFLLAHRITQPIFNTYEYGGYLIWRLWPQERVFIDGRALSESVFLDYARILYNHDDNDGPGAQQLLDRYGVQAIVMNGFEYGTGSVYKLAPALADPRQTEWKLVFSDPQAMVFLRHPPPDVQPLNSLAALEHLEAECSLHIEHEPQYPRCARSLGQVFSQVGDAARARRWIGVYLSLPHDRDPEAEQAFQKLLGAGQ